MSERKGDWIQTVTGGAFWPMDPRPEDVKIEDIAHALANQCRFSGHCRLFYSVAEHSVRVATIVPPEFRLVALLHDASEAYLVDLPRPIKRGSQLGVEYQKIEARVHAVVFERFGLDPVLPECIREADNILLMTEKRDLMGPGPFPWRESKYKPLDEKIEPYTPIEARSSFLTCFHMLRSLGR